MKCLRDDPVYAETAPREPQPWDLNPNIATRLWGKWAKSNILRSQQTINRMCRPNTKRLE